LCQVLKIIISILVLSSFLAKDLASFAWQTWFYINQQEIAAEKCENKAKPMMNCDGQCYLSKQLKKLEEKEQNHNSKSNPFQKIEKIEMLPQLLTFDYQIFQENSTEKATFFYKFSFSRKESNSVFRPPIV
jgi:hypothetical protein